MLFWEKKEGVERGRGALSGGMKGKEEWGRLCSDMGTWGKPIVIRGQTNGGLNANNYLFE